MREILNKDKSQVDAAKAQLEKSDSASNWKAAASKYSTDKATKSNGGLRKGVAKGQSEPALDAQIFSAPTGQLVGPFKGQAGYYLIEVDKVTPAAVTPLSKVETQIKQQLAQGLQQQTVSEVQAEHHRQVDLADLLRGRVRGAAVLELHAALHGDAGRASGAVRAARSTRAPRPPSRARRPRRSRRAPSIRPPSSRLP